MKQIFFLLILLGLVSGSVLAQTNETSGFRYAFKVQVGTPHNGFSQEIKANTPVIAFQFERRIKRISIGLLIGVAQFEGYSENHNGKFYYTIPTTGMLEILGIRCNYYFLSTGKFDMYAGIMASYLMADVGVYLETKPVSTTSKNGMVGDKQAYKYGGFKPGFQLGGHYWFSKRFGLWAEASYGTALFNLGIALRR